MQVKSFQIERFGTLQEQNVDGLSPSLNIILGQNEAGKSTTLNFFRAIFCGYTRKAEGRGNDHLDPMAIANRGGGSLTIESQELGLVRLLRRPGSHGGKAELYDANGQSLDEMSLDRILRGLTPSLFDNIYAFSLKELQSLNSFGDKEVSRIFSGAMMGLGKIAPGEALEKIAAEMNAIYTKRGGIITRKIAEIDAIQSKIYDLGPSLPRYEALIAEKDAFTLQQQELDLLGQSLSKQRSELELLRTLQPKWLDYCVIKQELASLPEPTCLVAPDSLELLDKLLVQKEEQELNLSLKNRELEQVNIALAQAQEQLEPAKQSIIMEPKILHLVEAKEELKRSSKDVFALETEQQSLSQKLDNCFAMLGADWNLERLNTFDRSINKVQELAQLETRLQKSSNELGAAKTEEAILEQNLVEAKRELEGWAERVAAHASGAWLAKISELVGAKGLELTGSEFNLQFNALAHNPHDLHDIKGGEAFYGFDKKDIFDKYLVNPANQAHFARIIEKQGHTQSILQRRDETSLQIKESRKNLQQSLYNINRDWNEELLLSFDFSSQARQKFAESAAFIRQAEENNKEAERELRTAQDRYEDDQSRTAALLLELEEFKNTPDLTELRSSLSALRQLRQRLLDLDQARRYNKEDEAKLAEFVQMRASESANIEKNWWQKISPPLACCIFFALACVSLIATGLTIEKDILSFTGMASGVIAAICGAMHYLALQQSKKSGLSNAQLDEKQASLVAERNKTRMAVDALMEDLPLLSQSANINLSKTENYPSLELSVAEEKLERQLELSLQKERLLRDLLPLQSLEEKNKYGVEIAERKVSETLAALSYVQEQWANKLEPLGFDPEFSPEMSPENAVNLMSEASLLRVKLDGINELEQQLALQEDKLLEFWAEALNILPSAMLTSLPSNIKARLSEPKPEELDAQIFQLLFELLKKQEQALALFESENSEHERLVSQWIACHKQYLRHEASSQKAANQRLACISTLQNIQSEWATCLQNQGLPSSMSPDAVRQFFQLAKEAAELAINIQDKKQKVAKLNNWRKAIFANLHELGSKLFNLDSEQNEVLFSIDTLRQSLDNAKAFVANYELLVIKQQEAQNNSQGELERLEKTNSHINESLAYAQVDNVSEFKINFESMQKWQNLKSELLKISAELQASCLNNNFFDHNDEGANTHTSEQIFTLLEQRLHAKSVEELSLELKHLEEELVSLNANNQNFATRLGEINTQLSSLKTQDNIAEYRAQEQQLLEEVAELSEQWVRLSLAYRLLNKTKRSLEEEHMPELIREAGHLFSTFTNGIYSRIILSMNESNLSASSILAETSTGQMLKQEVLSQGTKEQLYLSLRLAYIREHSQHVDSLPLIMDDILVNFDPKRARQTAKVLAAFSRGESFNALGKAQDTQSLQLAQNQGAKQQMFFFTCHPSTAALLHEYAPESKLLKLEKGSFSVS